MILLSPLTTGYKKVKYPKDDLVLNDIISQMGVTSEIIKGNPSQEFYKRAFMVMGNIPHGNALPSSYVSSLANNSIANTWWDAGAPWIDIVSGDSNTCTNARVLISALETYILRKSTNKWEKLFDHDGNIRSGLDYYNIGSYSYTAKADKKIIGNKNLNSFNDFSNVGARGTDVLSSTDYRLLHKQIHKIKSLPGGGVDLGGLFVTCLVKLVSESGDSSFNGVCKKYARIGFDFFPTITSSLTTDMAFSVGNSYNPGSGGSSFTLIPTNNEWFRLFYIPYLDNGAYLDNTSLYYTTNGSSSMCLTNTQITNKKPILLPNKPNNTDTSITKRHVLVPPLAGIAHEIYGVLASKEALNVFRQSFTEGGPLLQQALPTPRTDTGFPVIQSVTESIFNTDSVNHLVLMPAVVNAGDALIILFTNDGSASVTEPTGWDTLYSNANGTALRGSAYAKVALGNEGGTTVNLITSATEKGSAQVFRISNWNGTLAGIQNGISGQITTGNTANPPVVNAYWGNSKALWIAALHTSTSQTIVSAPTNYTDLKRTSSGETTADAQCISSYRFSEAPTEDPDIYTLSGSGSSKVYNTIAIAPTYVGVKYEYFEITRSSIPLWVGMYSSQSYSVPDPNITRAVIVVHGKSLDAAEYCNVVTKNLANYLGKVIVVAPFFERNVAGAEVNQIFWGSSWPELGRSDPSLPWRISSGEVLDELINTLYTNFVNLEGVVICGHSAGGQLCNRYSGASSDSRNRFLVSAASSYLYLDDQRPDGNGGWVVPSSPNTFNDYKYGLNNLSTVSYVNSIGADAIRSRLLNAKVHYMVGAMDNNPADTSMDQSAEGQTQGSNRVERQLFYHNYLKYYSSY